MLVEHDHVAEPVPCAPSDIYCEPVGVHVIPEGNVSVPVTVSTVEPDTDIIMLNVSPCETLEGIVTPVIEIEPVAEATPDVNNTAKIKASSVFESIINHFKLL